MVYAVGVCVSTAPVEFFFATKIKNLKGTGNNKEKTMVHVYSVFEGKIDTWNYQEMTKTKKGSPVVYITQSATSEKKLQIQLQAHDEAKCGLPFGISNYGDDPTNMRRTLDLTLSTDRQVAFWQSIDEQNVALAVANSEKWFGKVYDEDKIRSMYYPLVVFDESGKGYAPRLHSKVNIDPNVKSRLNVLEMTSTGNYKLSSWEKVKPRDSAIVIVEISSLWFQRGRQFGMSLTSTDVIIFPQNERVECPFQLGGDVKRDDEAVAAATTTTDENASSSDNEPPSETAAAVPADSDLSRSVLMEPAAPPAKKRRKKAPVDESE